MSCGSEQPRRVVVGIGNPDRGDDGIGRKVAQRLRGRLPEGVRIEEQSGGGTDLIETLRLADQAILVDAMISGAPAGTVRRLDCAAGDAVPAQPGTSSHGLGIADAIALALVLGCLPSRCVVFAVEAAEFSPGAPMTPAVAAAVDEVARRIELEFAAP
jgi:hydrogenase maturation protease